MNQKKWTDLLDQDVYNRLANCRSKKEDVLEEVPVEEIGEMVMQKLKDIDEVAYVRFASVYRRFTDATNFKNLLNDMKKSSK